MLIIVLILMSTGAIEYSFVLIVLMKRTAANAAVGTLLEHMFTCEQKRAEKFERF